MKLDGLGLKRLTNAPGMTVAARSSPRTASTSWRAVRPRSPEEQAEMKALLGQHLGAAGTRMWSCGQRRRW